MFLHCHLSKGSIIARYQLVLKKEHTLEELTQVMETYLKDNSGKLGDFAVKNIEFSGKLI